MEKNILSAVQTIGWLNFFGLILLLITLKSASAEQNILVIITASISLLGTIIYYFLWDKLFKSINQKDGLKYFKPYRLGLLVVLGAIILVTVVLDIK